MDMPRYNRTPPRNEWEIFKAQIRTWLLVAGFFLGLFVLAGYGAWCVWLTWKEVFG